MAKGTTAGAMSLGAAVLSAICCVGPLLLAIAGLGGGALFLKAAPYRAYFLGASLLLLGVAFYATYRRKTAAECRSECLVEGPSRKQKYFLWIVAAVVVLAAADLIL